MRRRSREINIFNMSLLDILCGALGAFCFMMLVLMPYYKPPKEQADLQKTQKEIQDELKKLSEMKDKISDAEMARDLEELVKKLQAQIQELQGRLNYTLAENQRLKEELEQLKRDLEQLKRERDQAVAENQQLRNTNQQLQNANQQLQNEKQRLMERNEQLAQQNREMQQQITQLKDEKKKLEDAMRQLRLRQPFLVKAVAEDSKQDIGMYLLDPAIYTNAEGKPSAAQPPFDPHAFRQPAVFPGDIETWVNERGVVVWMIRDLPVNMRVKVYVNLANPPGRTAATKVHVSTLQAFMGAKELPDVQLTPEHPWIYVGDILGNPDKPVVLREATQADREQEWKEIGSATAQGNQTPNYGSGGPHGRDPLPINRDGRRGERPGVTDATRAAEIASIKARISVLESNSPKDRTGAINQQNEIANLRERLKVLEGSGPAPGKN